MEKRKHNIDKVCVIVAHPDDEILWAGGTILMHPEWTCQIFTLCRGSDTDRAPKFHKVLSLLGASGAMADLDDGPDQTPLPIELVQQTILEFMGEQRFDLLLTHGPKGEYTRHRRHEETCAAILALRENRAIQAREIWHFAYEDNGGGYLPQAVTAADLVYTLPPEIWKEKYRVVTDVYGFSPESWEARTTPRVEAFWGNTRKEPASSEGNNQ